jgi:catechol 2,3-dioxygenase-like lactoylglutathione lyase family enzyme
MIQNADHVTFAVEDPDAAIAFFELLGFEHGHDTVIDGGEPAVFMGDPQMHARHVTLELTGSSPSFQVQLLHFEPSPTEDPIDETRRVHVGFNHLALRVDDLDAVSARLTAEGIEPINEPMQFIGRKLQFFAGPEGITLELVERLDGT